MEHLILPDSPSSVMQLLDADKQSLIGFAANIINSVHDGNENPLKIQVLIKKQELVLEKIKEGIKENVKTEAAKYGDKPFMYAGSECHLTPTYTSYDFEACNDPKYVALSLEFERLKSKLDERKEWLKAMGGPENMIDENTGEVYTIYPPVKKSSMGVKVTLK